MKRYHDWYKLQQDFQGWNGITPDETVINRLSDKNWSIDTKHCHLSLKQSLSKFSNETGSSDFFILTDVEIGKLPLDVFFKIVKKKYESSKHGGYIAILSYYLNVKVSDPSLTGSYKENIETVFSNNLSYVSNLENVSDVVDFPINIVVDDELVEGANFIFVHPNIRYFLWK